MIQFLHEIPEIVLYGCGVIVVAAFAMIVALLWQTWRVGYQVRALTRTLKTFAKDGSSELRDGLALATVDEIRSQCGKLAGPPREWWIAIDSHLEKYTSSEKED